MSDSWWEIQILCSPDLYESSFWRLEQLGCRGTASETTGSETLLRAYLPEAQDQALDLAALALQLRQDAINLALRDPNPKVWWGLVNQEDWASSWKKHWQPQKVGDRFLVCPAWLTPPEASERLTLRLDPGMAFGTGTHATTQLCLEAMEMSLGCGSPQTDAVVADIGCGSGILAIGAALLGVGQVYAVDTDPLAVKATLQNRHLNRIGTQKLIVQQGSLENLLEVMEAPVDGLVCNIQLDVILDILPKFNLIAKPETWGILSGILVDQADSISEALRKHGWFVANLWHRQQWCCFDIRRDSL